MAKGKGRSTRKQVSRETIAAAQWAKRHGFLSKQAKTTGGKISRRVERKIEQLREVRALPSFELNERTGKLNVSSTPTKRIGIKATAKQRRIAREHGFEVIGQNVIAPRGDKRFVEALKRQKETGRGGAGIRMPTPVSPGELEVIILDSGGIHNFADLFRALRGGKLNGVAKRPDEDWAFTLFGFHPRNSWTFQTDAELLKYLERYKSIQEEIKKTRRGEEDDTTVFSNFELVKVVRGENLGPTPRAIRDAMRREYRKKSRAEREIARVKLKGQAVRQFSEQQMEERRRQQGLAAMKRYRDRLRDKYGEEGYRKLEAENRQRRREAHKDAKDRGSK